jgi:transposase
MAYERLPMRKIKEVLRLKHEAGRGHSEIARSCGIAHSTVLEYLRRADAADLCWPLLTAISDAELEQRLFPAANLQRDADIPPPDCQRIYDELRNHRKLNLTLTQLWIEYKERYPEGYEYTQFCEHYRRWLGKRDYVMRQTHRAGEKLFVDYADGLSIVDPQTGELIPTQLFVATWGASNYSYAEASLTQELPSWIASHVRAFQYFGRAPRVLVPDNLKGGVQKACFYEPEINPTYAELASHYGAVVLPAKVRKPRYKAKVEGSVLIVKRWILAVLRHRTFFSLAELNAAIRELLEALNTRPLRKLKRSRRDIFLEFDFPAALVLPERPYQFAEWAKPRVNIDYHVELDRHYYSVPFQLLREKLDARLTATTIEVFHKGERVAAHARSYVAYKPTTLAEHMPPEHRRYAEWTPSRLIEWAGKTGPSTAKLVGDILASKKFPEQGYRAVLGVMRLGKDYGDERLEAACARALSFGGTSYRCVHSILARGLDRQKLEDTADQDALPFHENIRGGEYYH